MNQPEKTITEQNSSQRGMRFLISAAALVLIIWGMNQAQLVLSVVLVSGFLAVIGTPPVRWLVTKRVPPAAAVLIVMAGFILILLIVGVLLGLSVRSILASLPLFQDRLLQLALGLKRFMAGFGLAIDAKALLGYVDQDAMVVLGAGALAKLNSLLSGAVLILLTVSFILFEAATFKGKLRAALGDPKAVFPEFHKFVDDVKHFVIIQTGVSLIAGIYAGVWLAVLGVDFAVLFGLLAFVLNYVPNIGSVIAIIPAVLLAFIHFGPGRAGLVLLGYIPVTFIIGNVLQPRLMGKKLELSTLVVFLSLLFWGSLLGVIGMVLCVPFTMALKFGLERSDNTRWIAVLLERGPDGAGTGQVKTL